jgi:RNA polymerase sigma-70 factor (ECF subfamily)
MKMQNDVTFSIFVRIDYCMNTEIFLQRVKIIRPDLEKLARKKVGVQEDAEDLVQEVLMRLWLIREKWETHENCQPLAIHILNHCIIDRYRKIKEMETLENQHLVATEETPHQYVEAKDLGHYIWNLIAQLPPLQQLIMRLKDIEGHEIEEIAQITNTTPEAIRMNLSRARKKIRNEIV